MFVWLSTEHLPRLLLLPQGFFSGPRAHAICTKQGIFCAAARTGTHHKNALRLPSSHLKLPQAGHPPECARLGAIPVAPFSFAHPPSLKGVRPCVPEKPRKSVFAVQLLIAMYYARTLDSAASWLKIHPPPLLHAHAAQGARAIATSRPRSARGHTPPNPDNQNRLSTR